MDNKYDYFILPEVTKFIKDYIKPIIKDINQRIYIHQRFFEENNWRDFVEYKEINGDLINLISFIPKNISPEYIWVNNNVVFFIHDSDLRNTIADLIRKVYD